MQSQLSFLVNGVQVLKNMPLSESVANITTDEQGVILLNEPVIWGGQTEAQITVNAKPGILYGDVANELFVALGIELIGIGLI